MLRYELYICHSDHTWSDCHFVDAEYDLSEEEVIRDYKQNHPNADIVFIGVYNTEEI